MTKPVTLRSTFKFPPKLAPTGITDVDLVNAHTHSINHREDLFRSERCGCFNCLVIFPPGGVEDWTDEVEGVNVTAICPECGIDTVIGSASGYPIEDWFLRRMQEHWCSDEELTASGLLTDRPPD